MILFQKQVRQAEAHRPRVLPLLLSAIIPLACLWAELPSFAAPPPGATDDKRSVQHSPRSETSTTSTTSTKDSAGRQLTKQMNCRSCHIIEGDGGLIGPPLDGIGKHRDTEFVIAKLSSQKKPSSKLPPYLTTFEIMSHVRLPHEQSKAIADYLVELPETNVKWDLKNHKTGSADSNSIPSGSHFEASKPDASSARGKKLYLDHGCAACHSINSQGGSIGPSLDGVAARRSRNFIESRITNGALLGANRKGEYKKMGYRMPPTVVSKKELSDITDFLFTLANKSKPE